MMTNDSSYEHHPLARPLTVMRIDGLDWYSEDDWRALEAERDALRAEMQELRAALKAAEARAEKAEAERDRLRLTHNDLYYLRAIDRRLREFSEALDGIDALSIGGEALADELDWLDCFIANTALIPHASKTGQEDGET